jgi:DNA-binding transcriptional LysR family regulator
MESLLRPARPFDPRDTERDFAMTASEVGDLIMVQPLRRRLEGLAPSVRVGWMPGHGEETIEALRQGRCHFAVDIESIELPAPDIRVLKLYDDTLATVARAGHPLSEEAPDADAFAASDHIAVSALPTIDLLDRALAAQRLSCAVAAQVPSVLAGLLLALNSDALLTLPSSLASMLEKQFALARVTLPTEDVSFPVRLLWHSSYDRDECHNWVRDQIAALARETRKAA